MQDEDSFNVGSNVISNWVGSQYDQYLTAACGTI